MFCILFCFLFLVIFLVLFYLHEKKEKQLTIPYGKCPISSKICSLPDYFVNLIQIHSLVILSLIYFHSCVFSWVSAILLLKTIKKTDTLYKKSFYYIYRYYIHHSNDVSYRRFVPLVPQGGATFWGQLQICMTSSKTTPERNQTISTKFFFNNCFWRYQNSEQVLN